MDSIEPVHVFPILGSWPAEPVNCLPSPPLRNRHFPGPPLHLWQRDGIEGPKALNLNMEAVETGSANLHLTGRCQPMKPPQTAANHGLRNVLNKWYFPRDTPNQLHLTPQDSRPRTRPRKHISTYFGSGGGIERRGPFFPSPFASRLVDDPLTPPPLYYYSPPFIHSRN